ncbi:twin arginine-targeting protein translocase TatB [Pasteurellaceae bacterium RH1A]|nr:twin arginine-targeting protein translocase TatB [Pasteurellaceae bacterium RH1A]
MFDIGFSELVLIMIVGLVVLGPKRLPVAIKTVMGWVATIRGLAANVQNELAQELKLQELQESIKKAESLNLTQLSPELSKTVEELKQSAEKMKANLAEAKDSFEGLSKEEVSAIQDKIEAESQQLEAQDQAQQAAEKGEKLANGQAPSNSEQTLSADELAELAEEELDEEALAAYYPPDDDLAVVENTLEKEKTHVS